MATAGSGTGTWRLGRDEHGYRVKGCWLFGKGKMTGSSFFCLSHPEEPLMRGSGCLSVRQIAKYEVYWLCRVLIENHLLVLFMGTIHSEVYLDEP